jgi:hypothetical protein
MLGGERLNEKTERFDPSENQSDRGENREMKIESNLFWCWCSVFSQSIALHYHVLKQMSTSVEC